jgi:hypothetical protein
MASTEKPEDVTDKLNEQQTQSPATTNNNDGGETTTAAKPVAEDNESDFEDLDGEFSFIDFYSQREYF